MSHMANKKQQTTLEQALQSPAKNYPRTQSNVPVLATHGGDALVTRSGRLVMGLETIIENDNLEDDPAVFTFYQQLMQFFRQFHHNFQIVIYPRHQDLKPVLDQYRAHEHEWQRKQAVVSTFKGCVHALMRKALLLSRELRLRGEQMYQTHVDGLMQELCICEALGRGLTFSDYDLIPGALSMSLNDFSVLHDFFADWVSASAQEHGLVAVMQPFAPLGPQNLDAQAGAELLLDHILLAKGAEITALQKSLRVDVGLIQMVWHDLFGGAALPREAHLQSLQAAVEGAINAIMQLVDAGANEIINDADDTLQAIARINDLLVLRGKHLESIAFDQTIPVRKVCLLFSKEIGLLSGLKAISETAIQQTYTALKDVVDQARAHLESAGVRTRYLTSEEMLDMIRTMFDRGLVWTVAQQTQHDRELQTAFQSTMASNERRVAL